MLEFESSSMEQVCSCFAKLSLRTMYMQLRKLIDQNWLSEHFIKKNLNSSHLVAKPTLLYPSAELGLTRIETQFHPGSNKCPGN